MLRDKFTEALRSVFGGALREARLKRHPIGVDGWVEDVVAVLAYTSAEEENRRLREDTAFLAQRLFGTSYKSAPIRLTEQGTPKTLLAPPNLTVSAAELKRWLLDVGDNALISLDAGTSHGLRDLLTGKGRPGVYFTSQRGLVVLIVPRDQPLQGYRADIRKFVLDTDAIIGALWLGGTRLAIVGRERDTPIEAMPPLRTEMILALAATDKKELGQSYERKAPFAGKISTGTDIGKDWAPIYLSRDLINTELGGLLNITDQMLKSWSEAGKVEYDRFPYPKPASFPFKEELHRHLGMNEVTFNWNTVGVGSLVNFQDTYIFALERTGSLPVSYIPENLANAGGQDKVLEAEDRGYDFFSNLRDPYLARVVQYVALYQIFRLAPLRATRDDSPPTNDRAATEFLLHETRVAIHTIAHGQAEPTDEAVERTLGEDAQDEEQQLSPQDPEEARVLVQFILQMLLDTSSKFLSNLQDRFGKNVLDRLAILMADRSSVMLKEPDIERISTALRSADSLDAMLVSLPDKDRAIAVDIVLLGSRSRIREAVNITRDPEAIMARYRHAAMLIESSYIKTPSIVLSWWPAGTIVTGGHNLYGQATGIEVSSNIPKGQVIIEAGKDGKAAVLRVNPQDAPYANRLARTYERHAKNPAVSDIVRAEMTHSKMSVREPKLALALSDLPSTPERGLIPTLEGNRTLGEVGFRTSSRPDVIQKLQAIADAQNYDIVMARGADGYVVCRLVPSPPQTVHAMTETAMVETVGQFAEQAAMVHAASSTKIRIGAAEGFSESELWNVLQSQELHTLAGGGGGGGFLTSQPPEREDGFFFNVSRSEGAGGGSSGSGGGSSGYGRRSRFGDLIVLKLVRRHGTRAEEVLHSPVAWAKADIAPAVKSIMYPENWTGQ